MQTTTSYYLVPSRIKFDKAMAATSEPVNPFAGIEERAAQFGQLEQQGAAALGPLPEDLEEFYTEIAGRRSKVIRSKKGGQPKPLIVLFHGGGFQVGSPEQVTRPGREWASTYHAVVVCPSYPLVRRDPATRWPAAPRAAWAVVRWLAENAERELGATLDQGGGGGFICAGHSAGANLAAVATGLSVFGDDGGQTAVEKLAKPITGLFLNCPLLFEEDTVPGEYRSSYTSYQDNFSNPPLDATSMRNMRRAYGADGRSRWFSPANALLSSGSEAGRQFPPTYILAGQLDPLRDDAVVFEKLLAARQGRSTIVMFPDDAHAGWLALPFPPKSKNPSMAECTMAGMKQLLDGGN